MKRVLQMAHVRRGECAAPEADLVDVVRLQQHLPQQTQEERRRALHGEVRDDVILVGHRFPLPVLLLHVLLQVEAALLRNIILLEERLEEKILLIGLQARLLQER